MSEVFKEALTLYKEEKYDKAFSLFSTGSEQGDSRCKYALGACYYSGNGVEKNVEKGKELILKSIDGLEKLGKENVYRANMLIYLAYNNFDFLNDDKKRFEALNRLYHRQQEEMDGESLFDYAECFQFGIGVIEDKDRAYTLFSECYEKYHLLKALMKVADYNLSKSYDTFSEDNIYNAMDQLKKGAIEDTELDYSFRERLFYVYFGCWCWVEHRGLARKLINYTTAEEIALDAIKISKKPILLSKWNFLLFFALYMQGKNNQALNALRFVDFEKYNSFISDQWLLLVETVFTDAVYFNRIAEANKIIAEKLLDYPVRSFSTLYLFYETQSLNFNNIDYSDNMISILEDGVRHKEDLCMLFYGKKLLLGEEVHKNQIKGFENIKECCEITSDYSCLIPLGQCYINGLGTNVNYQLGFECFQKAYLLIESRYDSSKSEAALYLLFLSNHIDFSKDLLKNILIFLREKTNETSLAAYTILRDEANRTNSGLLFWLSEYAYNEMHECNYLADCYRDGIGTAKDISKAIKLYEEDDSYYSSESLCSVGELYYEGNEVAIDIDLAEKYFLASNCDGDKCYVRKADIYLFNIYSDKNSKKYNLQKALEHIFCAVEDSKDNDFGLAEALYTLGSFYRIEEYGMRDLELAKEYYERAKEHGLNCQYAIDSINKDIEMEEFFAEGEERGKKEGLYGYELEKFASNYAREKYAKTTEKGIYSFVTSLLHMNVDAPKRMFYIENELADDFGEIWNDLNSNSKVSMITAINTYSAFIEMGYEVYSKMDFSQVINGLSKSFEIELKEFFYTGFLKYLKHNNIDCEEFVNECAKQQLPFIDEKIQIGKEGYPVRSYSYREEGDDKAFSIGQIYFIINFGHGNRYFNSVIDRSRRDLGIETRKAALSGEKVNNIVVEYFNTIFSSDAFVDANRKEEIANYLIDLANDIKIIQSRRNPATHETIMTFDEAELCADYLIKIRKIFFGFMNKINKKYRKGFYIED